MNWDAIVAISQVVAAVGVILSLGFVGLQIKQNTRALQRTEHNSTMEQWTVIRQAIAQNRDIAELMTAGLQGERTLDSADQLRLEQMLAEQAWVARPGGGPRKRLATASILDSSRTSMPFLPRSNPYEGSQVQ